MESRPDYLFQEWGLLGGAVLVAGKRQVERTRLPCSQPASYQVGPRECPGRFHTLELLM